MRQMTGKQSISFAKAVYIEGSAAIVGEKEKDGPLGEYFSHTLSDPMCGQESWEEGESELQLATAKLAMQKANVRPEQIRMIFAGDLLAQSIASSFGLVDLNCPLYGLFGACSTMGEALSLGAMAVAGGYGDRGKYASMSVNDKAAYACGGIVVAGLLYLIFALIIRMVGVKRVMRYLPPRCNSGICPCPARLEHFNGICNCRCHSSVCVSMCYDCCN